MMSNANSGTVGSSLGVVPRDRALPAAVAAVLAVIDAARSNGELPLAALAAAAVEAVQAASVTHQYSGDSTSAAAEEQIRTWVTEAGYPPGRSTSSATEAGTELNARVLSAAMKAVEYSHLIDDGALMGDTDPELPPVWGPSPSLEDQLLAEKSNLQEAYEARRGVLRRSISRSEAAARLHVSEQAVTKQLERGSLLGLKEKGRWAIPSWQLDPDTESGVVPGIEQLTAVFPGGPVALAQWAVRPSVDLDGRNPRDLLLANRAEEVIAMAAGLGSAGW